MLKIARKLGEFLELDQASIVNGLARFEIMKICFNLSRILMPDVYIPLNSCVFGSRVVWIDLRYECLSHLYFHCGLITHDTKA